MMMMTFYVISGLCAFAPPPCSPTAQADDASDDASLKMPGLVSSSCSRTGTATPPLVEAQADGAQADEEADEKADEADADESPVERRVSAKCGSAAAGWRALQQRSEHHLAVLDRVGMLCSSAACLSLLPAVDPELWHCDAAVTALL